MLVAGFGLVGLAIRRRPAQRGHGLRADRRAGFPSA
jgi:hypothetical protein